MNQRSDLWPNADNLAIDSVAVLRGIPEVADVSRAGPADAPECRIIHLLDWHYVSRDDYAADLQSVSSKPLSDEEIDRRYDKFLNEVESVQQEQKALIRVAIEQHGLKSVYMEALTDEGAPALNARIAMMKANREKIDGLRKQFDLTGVDEADESAKEIIAGIAGLEEINRREMLRVGAAGQLLMSGEIEVLPLDDLAAYDAANPVSDAGDVEIDEKLMEARRDAIVKRLLERGPFAFIILGGAHDLAENVRRSSGGRAEYLRVTSERYREFAANRE